MNHTNKSDAAILRRVSKILRDVIGSKACRDEIARLDAIASEMELDLVRIPDPHEGGYLTYPAEKTWSHRVVVTTGGQTVFDIDVAGIVLRAGLTVAPETRVDLR